MEHDAVVRLLMSQRAMLVGYITAIVRDGGLAEDILQDVSLLVLKKCGEIEKPEHFPGWVRKAARFEAMNLLRKRRGNMRFLDPTILDSLDVEWQASDGAAPSAATEALRGCVEKLSGYARQLIDLRYREGITGQALADRCGRALNTVYVALSRTHKTLAECVQARLVREGVSRG